MERLRLYLDTCCFNRPFDRIYQDKIRFECDAVLTIIKNCDDGIVNILKSDILDEEIGRIPDLVKRLKVLMLYSSATSHIEINKEIINRAKHFQQFSSIKPFDALHLATAEYANADAFLTTDKKLLNLAWKSDAKIKVLNPTVWLMEVMFND
ncbi:MAG: PIN domain-containing protein [Defluviitaleaceae bacterium]|nr:PIN domain-containing protein [Defluviitaleaceae bacterium]